MSLPLLFAQNRSPDEILVVDASDDPAPIEALIAKLAATSSVPLGLIRSAPGLTIQRNVGLRAASGDIVFFPDDDSMLFPGAIDAVMRIYELDEAEQIAGVAAGSTPHSPLGRAGGPEAAYAAKHQNPVMKFLATGFIYIETRVVRSPYSLLGEDITRDKQLPSKLAAAGCQVAADQEGFRMSFRRATLGPSAFNESLTQYCLGEDKDVCYGLASKGMIVELSGDHINHHEFPGARHGGFRRGLTEVLNQTYIVCRHTPQGHRARRAFLPYFLLLGFQMLLRSASSYQRDRLRGYLKGLREIGGLDRASPQEIDRTYREALARNLPA
jgi:glycosyltransferase involved in cell wall biosynthesis